MDKVYPKLSVIMPVYNGAVYIEQAIRSVISQNYPNLEFIVIDGGSSDGSLDIINKYQSNIDYFETGKDNGMWHAINKGIMASHGEFIGWQNSDDYYLENGLLVIGNFILQNPDVDLVYGEAAHVDANDKFLNWHEAIPYNKSKLLHRRCYIPSQACFFRKSMLSYIGLFDTRLKWLGDWDMWKRIAITDKYKICFINEKIGSWRLHENTITSGRNSSRELYLRAIENIKSARKYSKHFISKIEIDQIPLLIIGGLGIRTFARDIKNKLLK